jgi:hypothetical protein
VSKTKIECPFGMDIRSQGWAVNFLEIDLTRVNIQEFQIDSLDFRHASTFSDYFDLTIDDWSRNWSAVNFLKILLAARNFIFVRMAPLYGLSVGTGNQRVMCTSFVLVQNEHKLAPDMFSPDRRYPLAPMYCPESYEVAFVLQGWNPCKRHQCIT